MKTMNSTSTNTRKLRGFFPNKIDGITKVGDLTLIINNDHKLVRNRNKDGDYSFYIASKYKQYEFLSILLFDLYPQARDKQVKLKRSDNEIHHAVKCGSYHLVLHLVRHDPVFYLNVKDDNDNNALHLSCFNQQYEIIILLLNNMDYTDPKQETINDKNKDGDTALHLFIKYCNKDGRSKFCLDYILLNKYINANIFNKKGYTALYCAINESRHGHDYNVKQLLDNDKVRLDIRNKETNETSLHVACEYGNVDIVKLIIEKSPKLVHAISNNGSTALMYCINYFNCFNIVPSRDYVATVKLLLEEGANINCKNKSGATPLHNLCNETHKTGEPNNNAVRLLEIFLKHNNINVNVTDGNSNTALHCACSSTNVNMVRMLLEHESIKVDEKNNRNHTPLMMIVSMTNQNDTKNVQILKMLIDQGKADVNSKTNDVPHNANRATGRTVLHQAMFLDRKIYFEELLRYDNVDVNCKHDGGIPILFEACNEDNMNGTTIRQLLEHKNCKRDITSDKNKRSVFHYAIMHYNVAALDEILKYPEINLEMPDSDGNTIFHYVIKESIAWQRGIDNTHQVDNLLVNDMELLEHRKIMSHYPRAWDDTITILDKILTVLPLRNLFITKNKSGNNAYDLIKAKRVETLFSTRVKTIINEYVFRTRCHTYDYMKEFMQTNKQK